MKIYDQNPSGAAAAETRRAQDVQQSERGKTGRSAGGGSSSSDRVELSGGLGRLSETLAAFQSDRAGRVQALAAEYQSGGYQPNSTATSRGMIGEALGEASAAGLQ